MNSEIKFIPVQTENGWEIQQITNFARFSSQEGCKQACDALYKKYNSKDWSQDIFFKSKLNEIPKDLFYKEPIKPTEEITKKFHHYQLPADYNPPKRNNKIRFDIFKEVEKFYKELPPFPSDSPIDVD